MDTPSNKGKQEGRQWETKGNKTPERRTHHPTKGNEKGYNCRHDKGRQDLRKADAPSNKGRTLGRSRAGSPPPLHIQQRETRRGTSGDKGRQDPGEGGHTIQQKEARTGTMKDKIFGKADTPSNTGKQEKEQWKTMGDKGGQVLGKADTPSNRGKQEGVQWETWGDKTLGKAKGSKKEYKWRHWETRPPGRRTRHPTKGKKKRDTPSNKASKKGDNGRQRETRP